MQPINSTPNTDSVSEPPESSGNAPITTNVSPYSSPSLSRSSSSSENSPQAAMRSTNGPQHSQDDDGMAHPNPSNSLRKIKKNFREKRRRDDLNGYFDKLRDLLLIEPSKSKVEKRKVLSECIRILENLKSSDNQLFLAARAAGTPGGHSLGKNSRKLSTASAASSTAYSLPAAASLVSTPGTPILPPSQQQHHPHAHPQQQFYGSNIRLSPSPMASAANLPPTAFSSTGFVPGQGDNASQISLQSFQNLWPKYPSVYDQASLANMFYPPNQTGLLNFQPQLSLPPQPMSAFQQPFNPALNLLQRGSTSRTDFPNWPMGITNPLSSNTMPSAATTPSTLSASQSPQHLPLSMSSAININVSAPPGSHHNLMSSMPLPTLLSNPNVNLSAFQPPK